jgi:mRNA-degrading endonuclease RelE of RelBE toxin-antitoxin system
MLEINFTQEAREDLDWFRKFDQVRILDGIAKQLADQPAKETRNRKRLRPGSLTEWELRIGTARVFYDLQVDANVVKIVAIGYKKGNRLVFRGQEQQP